MYKGVGVGLGLMVLRLRSRLMLGLEIEETYWLSHYYLGWKNLVKHVAIITQSHSGVGFAQVDVNIFVYIHNVPSIWVDLYQHFILSHGLHNISDVRTWLLKVVQLLPQ